jgi:hypothetical protein
LLSYHIIIITKIKYFHNWSGAQLKPGPLQRLLSYGNKNQLSTALPIYRLFTGTHIFKSRLTNQVSTPPPPHTHTASACVLVQRELMEIDITNDPDDNE